MAFLLGKVGVTIRDANWLEKKKKKKSLVEEASYQTLIVGGIAHGEKNRFLHTF
jgi:hypothetical protein